MKEFAYDRYFNYQELEALLMECREAHPDICTLEALAKTDGGRTIWGVTLAAGCTEADTPGSRPAFFVQGGLHAEEGMGVTGALALLHAMLEKPEYRKQLETVTVYILPCINPDACDECLTKGMAYRSMWGRLPKDTPNALIPRDLDGDGRILTMRWEDPTGQWKAPADCGGLLVQRLPGDTEGPFYHCCMEGILENYDGSGRINTMRRLDMNRQFPCGWKDMENSGDYPGKYTEPRTVMEFLLNHPNIFAAFDLHNGSRALIVDMPENPRDAGIVRKVTSLAKQILDLDFVTDGNYNRARGAKPNTLPGTFRYYMHDTFGMIGGTIELGYGWDSAGFTVEEIWNAPDGTLVQSMVSRIVEVHRKHGSQLAAPWVRYQHPQLGEVEIGGRIYGNSGLLLSSDMIQVLPRVTAFLRELMQWHPRLELVNVKAEALGGDVVRVRADVINTGKLGTMVLESASGYHAKHPLRAYISGADEVLSREPIKEFAGLDPLEAQKLEWFVRAKKDAQLTVTAVHPRGGIAKVDVGIHTYTD